MKVFLFFFLAIGLTENVSKVFRFQSGSLTIKRENINIIGSMIISKLYPGRNLVSIMAFDPIKKAPYDIIVIVHKIELDDKQTTAICNNVRYGNNIFEYATGTIEFTIDGDKLTLKGSCKTKKGSDWNITINGKESQLIYTNAEAAKKAESLINSPIEFWQGPRIIYYAIIDDPFDSRKCNVFTKGSDVESNLPGSIILGNENEHCGIVDSEGTYFIHDDKKTKKVIKTPINDAKRESPYGYKFKSYPKMFRQ